MLTRRAFALCATLAACATAVAAEDDADGVRRPERLTVGASDQLLGQLAPDGDSLYFLSNRNTITEVFRQSLANGRPKLLFDDGADVSWPRVSPDGKQLLYVSLRNDAAGELCVRTLPDGPRRCLAGASGVVQAFWTSATKILLLSRPEVQGDMRLSIVDAGGRLSAHTLVDRNLTSPTVSPDGRWLVYTPVERYVPRIGPAFAAHAGKTLMAQRLDRLHEPPQPIALDAAGVLGQAAFGLDGKWLYFVQFIVDTNGDGIIDGNDHGVLFRVPFDSARNDAPAPLTGVVPEQLTDASWNCQYPAPAKSRVVVTCMTRTKRLDIYQLPLDGVVPHDWTSARLRSEIEVTTSPTELLLLHGRLLAIEPDPSVQRAEMAILVRLHLRQNEFEAADYFARRLAALKDPATAGLGSTMRILCDHRRAVWGRERGRLNLDFADDSRKRLAALESAPPMSPAGEAMRHLLRSEIGDALGDKDLGRRELEAVDVESVPLAGVVELYADRADAFYRTLDDREGQVASQRRLAVHPALLPTERVAHARSAARAVMRGQARADAEAALTAARATVEPGSDLAFAYELHRLLLGVERDEPPLEVRERILALYRGETRPERRRAVILDGVQRGSERGAEQLIAALAALYVEDAPAGTIEKRRASRLYRRLVEDRAYAELRAGNESAARDAFFVVAKRTGSFESVTGYIDRRLRENVDPAMLEKDILLFAPDPQSPVNHYARAYLAVRRVPKLSGPLAEQTIKEAVALVRASWPQIKDRPEAVALYGALLHERFLHTGDREVAVRAAGLYQIALDLAARNPRYRAMLLEQTAQLQAQVANWRIALDFFEQREKLPFVDNLVGVAHKLVKARTLVHLDDEKTAAKLADEALAAIETHERMKPYVPLALDRAALYNLAADKYTRALELYTRLAPLVADERDRERKRNHVVAELGRAAAALAAEQPMVALTALDGIERTIADPDLGETLRMPHMTTAQVAATYRHIVAGLRAHAATALGRSADAKRALAVRRQLYEMAAKHDPLAPSEERARALVEAQLAELELAAGHAAEALPLVRAAVGRVEAAAKTDGKTLDHDLAVLLWLASEITFATDAPARLKLRARLTATLTLLGKQPDEKWRVMTRWFEIYLGLLGNHRGPAPPAKPKS